MEKRVLELKMFKPIKGLRYAVVVAAASLAGSGAWAQSEDVHEEHRHVEHEHLETSASLTITDILASALENVPESMETGVREAQAGDYTANGNSWMAGRPSLQLSYVDDGPLDNKGMQELEYGVQFPLRRPAQRRDARVLGQRYDEQVDRWKQALAWQVAGRVRAALADIAQAELDLSLQNQAVMDAEQLRDVTDTLFNAGEVARLELMQAQSLLVDKQAGQLQAEAMMVDAERAYTVLTGLTVRPERRHSERLTDREEIEPSHPQLQYLRSAVDLADSTIAQTENVAKGNPTVTIGSRRERPDRFQPTIDSVGVQLSIPFGGGKYVSAQTSSARRAKVDAEVAWQNAYIQLGQALHEVEHDLFILDQEEPLRRSQSEISRERYQMALTAFEVGEVNLAQVVVAQQEAQASDRALQMLLLERERLTTEYNQLIGVMP